MTFVDFSLDDYIGDFFLSLLNPLNRIETPNLRVPELVDSNVSFSVCNLSENNFTEKKNSTPLRNLETSMEKRRVIGLSQQPFRFSKDSNINIKRGRSVKPLFKYKSNKNITYNEFSQYRAREMSPFRINTCFACNRFANKTTTLHETSKSTKLLEKICSSGKEFKNDKMKLILGPAFSLSQNELYKMSERATNSKTEHKNSTITDTKKDTNRKSRINEITFLFRKEDDQFMDYNIRSSINLSLASSWSKLRNSEPIKSFGREFSNMAIERLSI
ncbi:hypothetical protein FG379_002052 [Cryptosporidium bovis]|uniref:uncharacterized protein n=1 Tax=Cryptosporidium bovis TaxID=310047 RepID=UPI00351A43E7|nr:hypothetical protein FG379_002052 [Cryptosporidium bovis]